MTTSYLKISIALLLLVAAGGIVSAATVRQGISYQGILTDASGNPLTGTYSVKFQLYDASTGGTMLSTDTRSVTAANGLFTTAFAVENPALVDGRAIWLGITVGADPEMTPRQEIWPVPYALSLRPGAFITGTGTSPALNLQNNGGGRALNISTWKDDSPGVYVRTDRRNSEGIISVTGQQSSEGVYAQTFGQYSRGVNVSTSGDYSEGVRAETSGLGSTGVEAITNSNGSSGLLSVTHGNNSHGLYASTDGVSSHGMRFYTNGDESKGVFGRTDGEMSHGMDVATFGPDSYGIFTTTYNNGSIGLFARTFGYDRSYGVYAYSDQSYGIWGETNRDDQMYGVYTRDYIYAKGTQYPALDVAEFMPVQENVVAGTVLVIGEDGRLALSSAAYDSRVAGIVSTDPGIFLGTKDDGNVGEALIAIAGKVPCRVDASSGAIHPGDLLTTSDTPGHAMKAEPTIINGRGFYPDGTILGKAMGTLESGTGTIEVLVTLQ